MGQIREELHDKLMLLLGSKNVYYQPPEDLKMVYPAIRYTKQNKKTNYANNLKYNNHDVYEIIVIDTQPDNPVINKILNMPYTDYNRHYTYNNLNHDVITLFYKEDK